MRALAVTLVTVVLLGGIAFGADQWATAVAEERTGARVSAALNAPAEVDLQGWPVGLRMLLGNVPRADVRATDVPVRGAMLANLHVVLTDVEVRRQDLGSGRLPDAGHGRFSARLEEDSLRELVGIGGQILDLSLSDGRILLGLAGLEVEADVGAADGELVIVPKDAIASVLGLGRIPISLADSPGSPYIEEAEIDGDALVLRGTLEDFTTG